MMPDFMSPSSAINLMPKETISIRKLVGEIISQANQGDNLKLEDIAKQITTLGGKENPSFQTIINIVTYYYGTAALVSNNLNEQSIQVTDPTAVNLDTPDAIWRSQQTLKSPHTGLTGKDARRRRPH
jgi:hypothetical protein